MEQQAGVGRGKNVAVRLSLDDVASIEALRPRLLMDWPQATVSDALRWLIVRGLTVVETWSNADKAKRIQAISDQMGPTTANRLVTLRLCSDDIERVEAQRKALRAESHLVTLSDILRLVIREGSAEDVAFQEDPPAS